MLISIVVPVFNEVETIEELISRIDTVAQREQYDCSILLVDDGSSDGSWKVIEALSRSRSNIRGLKLRRNFGKAAALAAGFEYATGDFVVTLDADLQDDPDEIPHLLAKLHEGYDVVSGWKRVRHDPWHKVLPSRLFNGMISWLTNVHLHDHNCGLKAYRRGVLDEVHLYGEMHRFVPVLAASKGFRVTEIVIQHHPRKHGYSKYGVERFVKGFLDLMTVYFLTGYGNRPQHLLGTIGLSSVGFGFIGLLILSVLWVVSRLTTLDDVHLHNKAIFFYCIVALLLGVQLISMGFIAELITAQNRPMRLPYSISRDTLQTTEESEESQGAR